MDQSSSITGNGKDKRNIGQKTSEIVCKTIFRTEDDGRTDDRMRNAAFADMFLSDTFCFLHGERGSAVCTEVTEKDEPLNARVLGCLGKRVRSFNIGGEHVATPPLRAGTGEMINLVYAAQCRADTALVIQTDHRHLHRNAFGN